MRAITEQILDEITAAIVRAVAPEHIYLFGSHARGDATSDSDIDLLIVETEPFGPERSRWKEIARIRDALPQQVAEIIEHVEKLIQNLEEMNKFRSLNYDCWY